MDRARLEAAGLYDPTAPGAGERLELLEWLAARGVTLEQMTWAMREGTLVGLAADLALRPGPHLTLEEIAARTGLSAERISEVRLAIGFPPGALGEREFREDDAVMLQAFIAAAALYGPAQASRFAHTLGTSLARLAEAAISVYLEGAEGPLRASNASELALAQRNLEAVEGLEPLSLGLQGLLRAHLALAIRRQRRARLERSLDALHLTVGFVDLVGFTTLSRRMTSQELTDVIDRFEDAAHDIVTTRDGRLVKLIGDEVMFVAVDASRACDIALTLLEHFRGDAAVTPRGGLAAGDLLFRGGDYYGPIVNKASRMAELAVPGELLVTSEVAAEATSPALHFEAAGQRMLKGFDEPVRLLTAARAPAGPR